MGDPASRVVPKPKEAVRREDVCGGGLLGVEALHVSVIQGEPPSLRKEVLNPIRVKLSIYYTFL